MISIAWLEDQKFFIENEKVIKMEHYKNNKLHMTFFYNKEGKLHREDGPAIVGPNKIEMYYTDGEMKKIIHSNGNVSYYKNKKIYKITSSDGTELPLYEALKKRIV